MKITNINKTNIGSENNVGKTFNVVVSSASENDLLQFKYNGVPVAAKNSIIFAVPQEDGSDIENSASIWLSDSDGYLLELVKPINTISFSNNTAISLKNVEISKDDNNIYIIAYDNNGNIIKNTNAYIEISYKISSTDDRHSVIVNKLENTDDQYTAVYSYEYNFIKDEDESEHQSTEVDVNDLLNNVSIYMYLDTLNGISSQEYITNDNDNTTNKIKVKLESTHNFNNGDNTNNITYYKWRKVNDNNFINPNVKYIITTEFDYSKNDFKSISNNFTKVAYPILYVMDDNNNVIEIDDNGNTFDTYKSYFVYEWYYINKKTSDNMSLSTMIRHTNSYTQPTYLINNKEYVRMDLRQLQNIYIEFTIKYNNISISKQIYIRDIFLSKQNAELIKEINYEDWKNLENIIK